MQMEEIGADLDIKTFFHDPALHQLFDATTSGKTSSKLVIVGFCTPSRNYGILRVVHCFSLEAWAALGLSTFLFICLLRWAKPMAEPFGEFLLNLWSRVMGVPYTQDSMSHIKASAYRLLLISFTLMIWLSVQFFNGIFLSYLLSVPQDCYLSFKDAADSPNIEIMFQNHSTVAHGFENLFQMGGIEGLDEVLTRLKPFTQTSRTSHTVEMFLRVGDGEALFIGQEGLVDFAFDELQIPGLRKGDTYFTAHSVYIMPKNGTFNAVIKQQYQAMIEHGIMLKLDRPAVHGVREQMAKMLADENEAIYERYVREMNEDEGAFDSQHIRLEPFAPLSFESFYISLAFLMCLITVPSTCAWIFAVMSHN